MTIFYEMGIENTLYWGCYALGFLTIFIFNAFYAKKYNIPKGKAVLFTIVSYILIYLWAYILAWVINGFEWGHHNAIRVYAWMPVVLFLIGKLFKINWKTACDYIAPSTCIVYGIARLGCIFTGCCYGIQTNWGMYSVEAGHVCFPVQLCEAITSLIIAVIIIIIARKNSYQVTGTLYPLMMIMFGGTRFIWEFFADSPRIIFNVTELGLWALFVCLIGVAWYATLKEIDRKKSMRKNPHTKTRKS